MMDSAPPVMVKASVLSEKLRSAIGDGVDSALLLTTSGALLCTASSRTDFARSQECRMLAALVANVWRTYAQSAGGMPGESLGSDGGGGGNNNNNSNAAATACPPTSNQNSDLEMVLAELETNKLCCFGLGGRAVLALFATSATELGMMKLKAASLQAELYDGLRLALRGNESNSSANSPNAKSHSHE